MLSRIVGRTDLFLLGLGALLPLLGCANAGSGARSDGAGSSSTTDYRADVLSVDVSGSPGAYQFSVTLRSPDTGCDRYADWWEVVRPDGALVYRRILAHSHVDEQPFTRSGGPAELAAGDEVIVRAHMNPGGYGGAALRGTPGSTFTADESIDASFAPELASAAPLPSGCAF